MCEGESGSTVLLSTLLFSTKNNTEQTCTRTVTSTSGVSTCVVHAVADLVDYHIKEHG